MAYSYFVILQHTWMISTFNFSERSTYISKVCSSESFQNQNAWRWNVSLFQMPTVHPSVRRNSNANWSQCIQWDQLAYFVWNRRHSTVADEDHLSVDPRKCYNCNWRILIFNWQFAEMSTEKACSATSTNVSRLKGGESSCTERATVFGNDHLENILTTYTPYITPNSDTHVAERDVISLKFARWKEKHNLFFQKNIFFVFSPMIRNCK